MKLPGAALLAAAAMSTSVTTSTAEEVVIVLDGSGSMWGQIDGLSKFEIARDVMGDLIESWPERTDIGLMAYGHRREADCSDIETLIAPGPLDRSAFENAISQISPRGRTPLTESIRQAAEQLSYRDVPATVILISDGLETCQADPCALSAELAQKGVDFTAHVVGFDLNDEEHAGLACIAENTGGTFVPAQNAAELKEALSHVQSVVELKPVEQEEPEPKAPPQVDIQIEAPDNVTTGASFEVSWSSSVHPRDYVTIVPTGAEEGSYTDYKRVQDATENSLVAPSEPGLYEVRYVLNEGKRVLASTPIEVVEAELGIAAPEQVTTGASFEVTWSSSVHPRDYVTIVPTGAEEGSYTDYKRVQDATENSLVAPSEPGLYEVRYVLNEGKRVLASTPIEVVEAELGIAAPEQVTTGASFEVSWSSSVHPRDYVTIVPTGAEEGSYTDYKRVQDATDNSLVAPSEPGLYEVRYVLNEGKRVLASTPIEVVEADVSITGPDVVRAGAPVAVEWTQAIHPRDYITIVPTGADEGSYGDYLRVGEKLEGELEAPAEPGLYEIRYVLQEGARTLADSVLEVVDAAAPLDDGAGLKVPAQAGTGETITISWTGGSEGTDQRIALARADQADFSWIVAHRVGQENSIELVMPDDAGRYEVRYLDISGKSVMGRAIVEVR
ncbi:MAG: hypothetical protein CMH69_14225 [Nitratireductor sp.]|nr:hypothetical protein [Nitratireductor sp.]